jgi:hypothetical protein
VAEHLPHKHKSRVQIPILPPKKKRTSNFDSNFLQTYLIAYSHQKMNKTLAAKISYVKILEIHLNIHHLRIQDPERGKSTTTKN